MITRFEGTTKVADVTPASLTIDDIYPIGIIVCGAKPTVGTWEKVEGRFLLGSSSLHKAGSTGGEETHKLTVNEMPSHRHDGDSWVLNDAGSGYQQRDNTAQGGTFNSPWRNDNNWRTSSTGGGQAHNNMPPYLSVDMWRRTA